MDAAELRFPEGFLWGAATSSHQVEGNNRRNDWWEAEESGALPFRSGEACRHYELFERDFDLARELGHNAHRFSLEWSRFEPEPDRWDDEAIAHYQAVVYALRTRGLEPIVCLHHFTNPAWFARRGGWLRADSGALFARYVERVAERLDGVTRWLTLNEPTVFAKNGYVGGNWPPGERGAWRRAATAIRNMARAHVAAYRAIHRSSPGAQVGFAHSIPWIEPCDPSSLLDRAVARGRDFLLNRSFLRLIGGARSLDFLGINYYTRTVVRWSPTGLGLVAGRECADSSHGHQGVSSDIGWEVYPRGLGQVLDRYADLGVPILISENGIATTDERLRSRYLRDHLTEVGRAVARGIPVVGYIHWTLMDNYEWSLGTGPRFGLLATEYETQHRTPRPAAWEFAEVCRTNRLPAPRAEAG